VHCAERDGLQLKAEFGTRCCTQPDLSTPFLQVHFCLQMSHQSHLPSHVPPRSQQQPRFQMPSAVTASNSTVTDLLAALTPIHSSSPPPIPAAVASYLNTLRSSSPTQTDQTAAQATTVASNLSAPASPKTPSSVAVLAANPSVSSLLATLTTKPRTLPMPPIPTPKLPVKSEAVISDTTHQRSHSGAVAAAAPSNLQTHTAAQLFRSTTASSPVDALAARVKSASASAAALAAAAPPTSFSSASHDEFASVGTKQRRNVSHLSGTRGNKSAEVSTSISNTNNTSLYRSPLSSRPLVRTLNAVLTSLISHTVRVELRNESWVSGRLEDVDVQGNLKLSNATSHRPAGSCPPPAYRGAPAAQRSNGPLENLFIAGRCIRYVILPDRVDGAAELTRYETQLDKIMLEFKRKKLIGKRVSREQQRKEVENKEVRLAAEMAAAAADMAAATAAAADANQSSAGAAASGSANSNSTDDERDVKRQRK
jgi:small nuclear ribonucleoprotein (snRNP)-like protein